MIDYNATNPMNAFMNTAGGLQNLQNNNMAMQQQYDNQAAAQQQAEAQQQAVAQAQQLLQNGTPAEIAQFGIANPELMTRITDAVGFQDNTQKQGRLKYAREVASGLIDPMQATQQRIAELESQGMDATHLKARLSMNPAEVKQLAEKDISVMDPKGYVDFLTAQGGGITPQQQQQNQFKRQELGLQREKFNFDKEIRRADLDIKRAKAQGDPSKLAKAEQEKTEAQFQDQQKIENGIYTATQNKKTIDDLLANSSYMDSITGYSGRAPTITTTGVEAEAYLDNIKNSMTIDNLGVMSGPLTDKDIQIIASASSRLRPGMSKTQMEKELRTIKNSYDRVIRNYKKEANRKGYELSKEPQKTPQQQVASGDYSSLWSTPQ